MNVLVTGGCGYIGSVLVPKLKAAGHDVLVVDACWFGDAGVDVKVDLRDVAEYIRPMDAIIHLAAVANDPAGAAFTKLTWEVNALATMRLAEAASRAGVKHFIYASSGSVYGVRPEERVTEETPLTPISDYNKTKMVAERAVLSYADRMAVTVVRPGTVCGYSPRTRLDVAVNALTMQALTKGVITVYGGDQVRPFLHIEDMTDLYVFLLNHPEATGIYNASADNVQLLLLAQQIQSAIPCEIRVEPSTDPRSYRLDSSKINGINWGPRRSIADAIHDLQSAFHSGALRDEPRCYNLEWMKARGIA